MRVDDMVLLQRMAATSAGIERTSQLRRQTDSCRQTDTQDAAMRAVVRARSKSERCVSQRACINIGIGMAHDGRGASCRVSEARAHVCGMQQA
jgi:hypothetical protein